MSSLHVELVSNSPSGCKVCSFIRSLPSREAVEWVRELGLTVSEVGNSAIVKALQKRGIVLNEASVRRHRTNHAS